MLAATSPRCSGRTRRGRIPTSRSGRTKLSIQLGGAGISADLRHWVNEGLMTFFFLVVGLEAKRELDLGELRERSRPRDPGRRRGRRHACPDRDLPGVQRAAARGAHGWGAAMSTDTAFALGVLALVAPRRRPGCASSCSPSRSSTTWSPLLVIATVYTEHCRRSALAIAVGLFARPAGAALRAGRLRGAGRGRRSASAMWVAMFESGIDPIDRRAGGRPGHQRLPAGARRPRAGDRADPLVPRAADARARPQRRS